MTIDSNMLELLVCPELKAPLSLLPEGKLQVLNQMIRSGKVKNRSGKTITESLDAALLREDGAVLYPIRGDIPVMLVDEGIPASELQL